MTVTTEHAEWRKSHFDLISDGGLWGIPRSGLIFEKRGDKLVLVSAMPHHPTMPITEAELREQQDDEFTSVRHHFAEAGIVVERNNETENTND